MEKLKEAVAVALSLQGTVVSAARPARLRKGIKLAELARVMDHDKGHLSCMERGVKPWTQDTLLKYYLTLVEWEEPEERRRLKRRRGYE